MFLFPEVLGKVLRKGALLRGLFRVPGTILKKVENESYLRPILTMLFALDAWAWAHTGLYFRSSV